MAEGALIPILIASSTATAAVSVAGARSQQRALDRSQDIANRSAAQKSRQIATERTISREQRIRQLEAIRGRAVASGAARGVGAGSLAVRNVETQALADAAFDLSVINTDFSFQQERLGLGLEATSNDIASRRPNLALSTVEGAVLGLQTGISIASGFDRLNNSGGAG